MPMGVSPESIREMSPGGLRELLGIAREMAQTTTIESLRPEYQALADMVETELREREAAAVTTIQMTVSDILERKRNRAVDNDRIEGAKQRLKEAGIDISVDPKLISDARLYHLSTVVEAFDAVASKNKYLTQRAPRRVKRSQLPSRPLQEQFDAAEQVLDSSMADIRRLVDDRIAEIAKADQLVRTVTIPAAFKQNGTLVDYGTFLYPGAGSIAYNQARTYLLAPNRALVHVKDELPQGATPKLAGQYLAALVAGCMQFISGGGCDKYEGQKTKVNGFLPSGKSFFWWMIGKKKASMQGYAGEIFHIDSGYAKSRWRWEK